MSHIGFHRHSLSLKLGVIIIAFVVVLFTVSLGSLYIRSRQLVKEEAMERAEKALDKTALRVTSYLNEVEAVTENVEWTVNQNQNPDSLLIYTHRIVALGSNIDGCSITMEPDFYPPSVGHFSAYTVKKGDSVITQREGEYDYYSKVWYKMPKEKGKPCWIDPYDDFNAGTLSNEDMIVSYSLPLKDKQGRFIGVISTDLSLTWLSKTISEEKPYPHSYSVMLGHDGRYYVHPDPKNLVNHTIFSAAAPDEQAEMEILGQRMLSGLSDRMRLNIGGKPCYVFFQTLEQTGWCIALICPERDILGGYNRLGYIIFAVLAAGLILLLLFFMHTITRFVSPLNQLVSQSHHIASGNFGEPMPRSRRTDLVGHLQNSFSTMQESLTEHIGRLEQANEKAEERNRELQLANDRAQEARRQKVAFLQDVSHQIRTPLNIIQGFLQVILKEHENLSQKEIEHITVTMEQNAFSLRRMAYMLYDAFWLETGQKLDCHDFVSCNEIARRAINAFTTFPPYDGGNFIFETSVDDGTQLKVQDVHLYYIIHELLYNAKKFAPNSPIKLSIYETPGIINFAIEDQGPGIPKHEQSRIFDHFSKLDPFTEGLGMGLYVSRQYIRLMGGDLTLDPTYEKGSRFIIRLPLTSHFSPLTFFSPLPSSPALPS